MVKKDNTKALNLRKKAESLLKSKQSGSESEYSEADVLRLIHELEVYQIELELQNEELVLAKEKAELSEEKYTTLYDFAPSGYFTLSREGEIMQVNLNGAKMLGKPRTQLNSSLFAFYVSDHSKPVFDLFFQRVMNSEVLENCEVKLFTTDGIPRYVFLTGIRNATQSECLLTMVDITARKQAELELNDNKLRFELLFNKAPLGYQSLSNNGKFIDVNQQWLDMLGYTHDEVIGKWFGDFVSVKYREAFRDRFEVFKSLGEIHSEFEMIHKNGHLLFISFDGRIGHDLNGEFKQTHCILQDITLRREYEEKIQSFNRIFEESLNEIYIFDAQTLKFVFVNKGARHNLGYSSEELKRFSPIDIKPEFSKKDFDQKMAELAGGQINRLVFETIHQRKDGTTYPVEVNLQKSNYDHREVFVAMIVDLTNRKKAEEALRDSESRARALVDALPDLMFRVNKQGVFLEYKATSDELFVPEKSIVGEKIDFLLPDEVAGMLKKAIDSVLKTGKIEYVEYQLDMPLKGRSDFEARMVSCQSDEVLCIVRDITVRKKNEAEIERKNQQLRELNRQKDKFFSIIAHDLKSPFNAIIGFSNLLVEQVKQRDSGQIEKYATIIQQSSERAMDLLLNLLEWSQSQTGRMEFNPTPCSLNELVNHVFYTLNDAAQQKSISIKNQMVGHFNAYADQAMISTVLRNLVSNALKFTHPGGGITIAGIENPDEFEVLISDNGIGIPKSALADIFKLDSDYTSLGTQNEKGTGLGLILCKEFIGKHGGRIWVESEEGEGSTFHFTLPKKIKS